MQESPARSGRDDEDLAQHEARLARLPRTEGQRAAAGRLGYRRPPRLGSSAAEGKSEDWEAEGRARKGKWRGRAARRGGEGSRAL